MRTLVILNPVAGGGLDQTAFRTRVEKALQAEIKTTAAPGHASRLAVDAVEAGYERIVVAGGDGTVNEVVGGLAASSASVEVGLLPIGTGNDLARSVGIPLELTEALKVVRRGLTRRVDLIRATTLAGDVRCAATFVANAAVGGFCGRISERMDGGLRRRWRALAYIRAAVSELAEIRPYRTRLVIDQGEALDEDAYMVIVANGRFAGGRIPFAPSARLDDGLLDLVVIRAVAWPHLATLVPRLLVGRHTDSRHVLHRQAREVTVESTPGMWLNVDGETWHEGAAKFRIQPAALLCIAS